MVAVPSDADLATEALAGSQEAYRELVSRYATAAVNLSARLVRDRALAEDLAQEAFVRAFTRLASYDPRRKFSSWFLQVVHNVAVDHLRRKRLSTVPLDDPPATNQLTLSASSTEPSPAAHAEREELRRALEQALAAIRPEYREALVLHYQEGLTLAEISGVIGSPIGTIKTFPHRGRAEMASILAGQGWGGGRTASSKPDAAEVRRVSRDREQT